MFDYLFNIDLWKQIKHQIPFFLRREKHLLFLKAVYAAFKTLLNAIKSYRDQTAYELSFTGSKIYMEHWLNDRFDAQLRRIYIANAGFINPGYRYNKDENRDRWIYNQDENEAASYMYNSSEITNQPLFIVYVPIDIELTQRMRLRIRKEVDRFNICTIAYLIKNYE